MRPARLSFVHHARSHAPGALSNEAARLLGAASLCAAQGWPAKPLTIVVPFPTGGTTDVLARAIATRLGPVINQSVIVDNRPGAGATLGAALVAKAAPDGHTLLMGAVHHTIATSVYKKLSYSFQKDFTPITTTGVAVSTGCWAHRRGRIRINADLSYDIVSHQGVTVTP